MVVCIVLKAVPVRKKRSGGGFRQEIVVLVVRQVLFNCVNVCSGVKKYLSASLFLSSFSEVSINKY